MQVNLKDARTMLERAVRARLVPMLHGSPGCGKSAIVHQMAEHFNLKVIDVRLAQCDPTDLLGLPNVNKDRTKACYLPMNTFPLKGDPKPEGYAGWLLFLDEFNSADKGVQKAAYKLILDRMVGEYPLHNNVAIVCAGNLDTDNAIVEEMSTALQSRLVHIEAAVNAEVWLDWARKNGIDHRITSYIQYRPDNLFHFNPDHDDRTFACCRTWEFASRIIKDVKELTHIEKSLLCGTISEGIAREFIAFERIFQDLPSISDIASNPEATPVPSEPSTQYALTGILGNFITKSNVNDIMKFINRLPKEFQVITMREIVHRDETFFQVDSVNNWLAENATDLF